MARVECSEIMNALAACPRSCSLQRLDQVAARRRSTYLMSCVAFTKSSSRRRRS
jgi:hypothetical protein